MTIGANGPGAVALGEDDRVAAAAAVKAVLRVATADEDALIATLAETALGLAERFTGAVTIARTMTATLDPTGGWQRLPAAPVRSIAAVARGGAVLAVGSYAVDIDADGGGWVKLPASPGPVSVTLIAGTAETWAALPAPLRHGVAMLAAHLFTAREESEAPPAAVAALWRPFRTLRPPSGGAAMMERIEARGRAAAAAARVRLAERVASAVRAAASGVTVAIEGEGVVLSGRGLRRRLDDALRWIGGLLR